VNTSSSMMNDVKVLYFLISLHLFFLLFYNVTFLGLLYRLPISVSTSHRNKGKRICLGIVGCAGARKRKGVDHSGGGTPGYGGWKCKLRANLWPLD
jgi:hypothetical protein